MSQAIDTILKEEMDKEDYLDIVLYESDSEDSIINEMYDYDETTNELNVNKGLLFPQNNSIVKGDI